MTYHITLTDPMNGTRIAEPITFTLPEKLQEPVVGYHQRGPADRLPAPHSMSRRKNSTAFIATVSFSGTPGCSLTGR